MTAGILFTIIWALAIYGGARLGMDIYVHFVPLPTPTPVVSVPEPRRVSRGLEATSAHRVSLDIIAERWFAQGIPA